MTVGNTIAIVVALIGLAGTVLPVFLEHRFGKSILDKMTALKELDMHHPESKEESKMLRRSLLFDTFMLQGVDSIWSYWQYSLLGLLLMCIAIIGINLFSNGLLSIIWPILLVVGALFLAIPLIRIDKFPSKADRARKLIDSYPCLELKDSGKKDDKDKPVIPEDADKD